jgi:hypothetical protein
MALSHNSPVFGSNHLEVLVRGMYAVASIGGVHLAELRQLRVFYENFREQLGGDYTFDELIEQPLNDERVRSVLTTPQLRQTFIKACLLLTFTDGSLSETEGAEIDRLNTVLDITPDQRTAVFDEVRGYLLRHLGHIQNVDALSELIHDLRAAH